MNVQELIDQLTDMNPETEVMFQYNFGDYWRTEVAAEVKGVSNDEVVYSEYHRMHKVVSQMGDRDEDDEDERETKRVVILTSSGW